MDRLLLPLIFYAVFLVPAALGCILVQAAARRVAKSSWDWLLLVLPWLVWWLLSAWRDTGKTLSNAMGEPVYLAAAVTVIFLMRSLVGLCRPNTRPNLLAAWSIASGVVAATGLWALVPGIPE